MYREMRAIASQPICYVKVWAHILINYKAWKDWGDNQQQRQFTTAIVFISWLYYAITQTLWNRLWQHCAVFETGTCRWSISPHCQRWIHRLNCNMKSTCCRRAAKWYAPPPSCNDEWHPGSGEDAGDWVWIHIVSMIMIVTGYWRFTIINNWFYAVLPVINDWSCHRRASYSHAVSVLDQTGILHV